MGSIDYTKLGSPSGYTINPDVTWGDPKNRRVKVLTVGAGVSGILMAYHIQKHCENVEHVIYEKNSELGGTWLENRYPGVACDIPSHAYTMNFALNPDWPRFFSYAPDIQKYLLKIVETFNLRKFMTFNTEVVGAYWIEEKGQWQVKLRQKSPDGSSREFEEQCDVFLYASGILNNFKWPNIEGLHDFKGKVVHTAAWPADYGPEQWKNDRVAVIGSGASSIQTVPTMQPHAKSLDVFVRTGVWFVDIAGNAGHNKEYHQTEKDEFRKNPSALVKTAKEVEDRVNGLWGTFYSDSEAQTQAQTLLKQRMAEFIKDDRLLQGFTPKFGVGCRRVTPGDPYMQAINKENVNVHFTAVKSCTASTVVGFDGTEREVDTVVCATGFDVSYKPRFPIVGRNGVDLRKKWTHAPPEGYLGLAVPDMPNFIFFIGSSWPVENGSVMGPLHNVSEYAIQWIKKIQHENIKSFVPRQDITDSFNEHVQEWIKHTVWKDACRSWYRDNDTGRVNAVYPGSSMHYQKLIEVPRYEDFSIQYFNKNPWAFMGFGWTQENRLGAEASDCSPYLTVENIDPKWYEACGGDVQELKKQRDELITKKEKPSGIERYL